MRLGVESVGRWGLALLAATGVVGMVLAIHGWSVRDAGLPRTPVGSGQSPAIRSSTPRIGPTPNSHRQLLSAQPYANVSFQVWPGNPSAAAKAALTGLKVVVTRHGSDLMVSAGIYGQPAPAARRYAGGARVYVVESTLGDDSGNSDYNLGDDAVIVTDASGGIVQ